MDCRPGEITFGERCLKSGTLSKTHTCVDIGWCKVSKCGNHGKCKDGSLTYTCTYDDGYVAVTDVDGQQSFVNIDECITLGGAAACSCAGSAECGNCSDDILAYTCSCDVGFELLTDSGKESCSLVTCDALPGGNATRNQK